MNKKPQVRHHFAPAIWARGVAYAREHRVKHLKCEYSVKSSVFTADVIGSRKVPYEVEIHLALQKNYTDIQSECSCPMYRDCKHVAAVLFILEMENKLIKASPVTAEEILNHLPGTVSDNNVAWQQWYRTFKDLKNQSPDPAEKLTANHAPGQDILVYILGPTQKNKKYLLLELKTCRLLKKGGLGQAKPFLLHTERWQAGITQADKSIVAKLLGLKKFNTKSYYYDEHSFSLCDLEHIDLIPKIIASGRCFWKKTGPGLQPLSFDGTDEGNWSWQFDEHLMQSLCCEISGVPINVYQIADHLCYLDATHTHFGFLQPSFSSEQALALLQMPKISPTQIPAAKQAFFELANLEKTTLPPLKSLAVIEEKILPVSVLLYFYVASDLNDDDNFPIRVKLYFCYGSQKINWYDGKEDVFIKMDEELVKTRRDKVKEREYIETLLAYDMSPVLDDPEQFYEDGHRYDFVFQGFDEERFEHFFLHDILQLRAQGWQIIFSEDFPIKMIYEDLPWYAEVNNAQENHWFDFEMGVEVEGKKINLLPALLAFIHEHKITKVHEDVLLPLPELGHVKLSGERFNTIVTTLFELYGTSALNHHDRLTFTKQRAAFLLEMQQALSISSARWIGWEKLAQLAQALSSAEIKSVPIPQNFNGTLRDYQHAGLNWLQFLREYQLGGILADDMGLGKTIQTLAHIQYEKNAGRLTTPCLIVCPTSLLHNWQQEIQRFTPQLKCLLFYGAGRSRQLQCFHEFDIIITTYALVLQDKESLLQQAFYYVVLDEAQAIKNPRARSSLIVQQLNTQHRLCLTGTPMENHLGDLWSLFHFLMPGFLGTLRQFNSAFRQPIENKNDQQQRAFLNQRTKPFLLRRTKEAVAQELPSKIIMVQSIELSQPQRDLYETIRLSMESKVRQAIDAKGFASSQIVILDALLKLRQVCCDPRVMPLSLAATITEPVKLSWLLEILPNLLAEGRRVLLFSTFKTVLLNIAHTLQEKGISFSLLTGDTRDRKTQIAAFQTKQVPLFLISLKAGGVGLNLTAADTVIHYDPWWNPAAEAQATDRAHRIGQDKTVFVYKLITKNTVEEKMLALQEKKASLLAGILSDDDAQQNYLLDPKLVFSLLES